jgi:tetratricopeptide (TPR) repeat protein
MYVRYFLWNFLGTDSDERNYNIFKFLGIPFLLGLLGVWYHFRKDWKHALAVFVLFFMTGLAIILYLNQPDPQPRERDYSYVGSFFAFSIWIGIGAAAILEFFTRQTQKSSATSFVPYTLAGLLFIVSPVQVMLANYRQQDRHGNYVAWDYSYNMLMSCEQDGILYTNGDNDTFPLWYLQEVEYVRTDVRVANLSLLNTDWYVYQLKNHEPKVPISLSNDEIERLAPVRWPKQRTLVIDVPEDYRAREAEMYKNTMNLSDVNENSELSFSLGPKFFGQYLRVQDYMILNTLYANKFRKPMYFAVTVSKDNMLDGLQKYLRMDGLSFKITTIPNWQINPDTLYNNVMNKYKYRNLNNPDVYYNKNVIALLQNYRSAFIQLANYYATFNEKEKVRGIIEKLDEVMPPSVIPFTNNHLANWIEAYQIYSGLISKDTLTIQNYTEKDLEDIARVLMTLKEVEAAEQAFQEILTNNPDNIQAKAHLVDIYGNQKKYDKSIEILEDWVNQNPNDAGAKRRLEQYRALKEAEKQK